MNRRSLGPSGLTVSPIGLGAMPMSFPVPIAESESTRLIHASLDAGVDLIDTADVYCPGEHDIGHNERVVAQALRDRPDRARILVATKGGMQRPGGSWTTNGHPGHLKWACERSLKVLGVDRIALYQFHRPDPWIPFMDSVGALADLRTEGKIERIGLSNVSVDQIRAAQALVPIASVQNCCSPFERMAWQDGVLRYCESQGIGFLAYSPVGGGGKSRVANHPTLRAVGDRHGVSPFQVALAWLLAKSPVMIPIPGASKLRNALDSAAAMQLQLRDNDIRELDGAFPT